MGAFLTHPLFLAAMVLAAIVAAGLLWPDRRTPMSDAAQAETLAAAQPAAPPPVVLVDLPEQEDASFSAALALLAAHRDDVDSDPFPSMPRVEALLRARRVRVP